MTANWMGLYIAKKPVNWIEVIEQKQMKWSVRISNSLQFQNQKIKKKIRIQNPNTRL